MLRRNTARAELDRKFVGETNSLPNLDVVASSEVKCFDYWNRTRALFFTAVVGRRQERDSTPQPFFFLSIRTRPIIVATSDTCDFVLECNVITI